MKILSTFTGIGGFEIGIQNAYRSTNGRGESGAPSDEQIDGQGLWHSPVQDANTAQRSVGANITDEANNRPSFVGYSEIDEYAISVYEKHFKGAKNYGDITKLNTDDLPEFDCIVGGFPCQAFSIAGQRRGFEDTRGTLFFELARILRAKQPRLFVFENVKGLLSHDGGRTFATIITTITELGYDAQWQVINSKDHGVPQNRERIIIVGNLRGTPRPQVFPLDGAKGKDIARLNNPRHSTDRVYDVIGAGPAISTMQGGGRQPYIKAGSSREENTTHPLTVGMEIRKLTPLECERLQAFPDDWTKYDVMGNRISDTQRYKMAGNAVTTNVIQAVFERIFESEQ